MSAVETTLLLKKDVYIKETTDYLFSGSPLFCMDDYSILGPQFEYIHHIFEQLLNHALQ